MISQDRPEMGSVNVSRLLSFRVSKGSYLEAGSPGRRNTFVDCTHDRTEKGPISFGAFTFKLFDHNQGQGKGLTLRMEFNARNN